VLSRTRHSRTPSSASCLPRSEGALFTYAPPGQAHRCPRGGGRLRRAAGSRRRRPRHVLGPARLSAARSDRSSVGRGPGHEPARGAQLPRVAVPRTDQLYAERQASLKKVSRVGARRCLARRAARIIGSSWRRGPPPRWLRLGCVWCYVLPRSATPRSTTVRRNSACRRSNSFVLTQELQPCR
jgi:hypothetical protein